MRKCQHYLLFICFLLGFACTASAENSINLTGITVAKTVEGHSAGTPAPTTQITLYFNQPPVYKVFTLPHPNRLVIDLQNTHYSLLDGRMDFSETPLLELRHGVHNGTNLRVVFDLKQPVNFKIETAAHNGFQLILLLSAPAPLPGSLPAIPQPFSPSPSKAIPPSTVPSIQHAQPSKTPPMPVPQAVSTPPIPVTSKSAPTVSPPPALPLPLQTTPALPSSTMASSLVAAPPPHPVKTEDFLQNTLPEKRLFTVIIDAGHGGKDPGAKGADGTKEKNVTLAVAKALQALINTEPNMKAVMTRSGDYYVGLRERLKIARKNQGDIFVAIHADTFEGSHAQGASVFALSLHGASSEAALWLAKKENYSELGGIDLNNIQDKDTQVRSVLIDLSQTAAISASLKLGKNMLQQLGKITELHHGTVEQAPFMVLKSPDIPSVLIETGFLSNPVEDLRLKTKSYQQKIASALMAGIKAYHQQSTEQNLPLITPNVLSSKS